MQRKKLFGAVEAAARKGELYFHAGLKHQINTSLKEMPALWLSRIEDTEQKGLNEGIKTLKIEFLIIDEAGNGLPEQQEQKWQGLELRAGAICREIGEAEFVKNISDIKFKAAENTLSNRNEISLTVTLNVHIPFCNTKN